MIRTILILIITVLTLSCTTRQDGYVVKGKTGADIQRAIDLAYTQGGGKVIVPEGTYNVGSIQLKSNIELHLDKGAVLLGGTRSEDYDSFPLEVCSIRPENSSKVLIYAHDSHNISITGDGVIDAQGLAFFDTTQYSGHCFKKPSVERPRMVQLIRCDSLLLQGVTFKDSPCWTMFIRQCSNVTVDGITITADQRMINNDGIDFDGCRTVRVTGSRFKTCDDCLILRAMREYPEQHVVCEDIIVRDCRLDSWNQTVRLGCPSDDTIRDALFTGIVATGYNGIFADYPVRYLRPDDEGYMDISNIVFDDYRGTFTNSALQIVSQPGVKPRRVDGMVFRSFNVTSRKPLRFIGNAGHEIGSVTLENFSVNVLEDGVPFECAGCDSLYFKNVSMNGVRYDDGLVPSGPGSDAPLERVASTSWESRQLQNMNPR